MKEIKLTSDIQSNCVLPGIRIKGYVIMDIAYTTTGLGDVGPFLAR
jgi:hypothetical protein